MCKVPVTFKSRDSSVGIATRYGLDGPEIECRWWRDFPHLSRKALEPSHPPIHWVPGLSREKSGRGVVLTTQPSNAEVKERVELYLYSPYELSWPVLGRTLCLFYLYPVKFITKRMPDKIFHTYSSTTSCCIL